MNIVIESRMVLIPSCITFGSGLIATGGGGGGAAAGGGTGWEGGAGGAEGTWGLGWADCCWSLETTGPLVSVDGKSFDEYSNPLKWLLT